MEWKPRKYEIQKEGDKYRILSHQTGKLLKPIFDTQEEALFYIQNTLSKELSGD